MPPACSIVILQPSDDIVFCHSCSGQKSSNKWLQRVPDTLQEQPAVLYCSGLLFEGERAFPRAGSDYLLQRARAAAIQPLGSVDAARLRGPAEGL